MLTLKEVYKIMTELWDWCAENPRKAKHEWPGWEKYGEMAGDCPCCEYLEQHEYNDGVAWTEICPSKCPAVELWPNHCEKGNTPYNRWANAIFSEDGSKAAKEIADFARRKLEEVSE